ncbi:aminotransferase class IV [Streptomyces sp. 900105755]
MSDAVVRALAVFDGMRAELTVSGRIRLLSGRAHVSRLLSNARSMRLPVSWPVDEILAAAATVARAELETTGKSVAYVRPMALGARLTGLAQPYSLAIAAFAQDEAEPAPVRVQLSALRRPAPDALPAQVKAVANYQLSRLARLAARAAGFDDALLLNAQGRLAEAAGAAVLVERAGRVLTPPSWEGCLPSITVDVIERIAGEIGVPFVRDPVTLADLWSADGVALAGTLADVVEVTRIDDLDVPVGPLLGDLGHHYREAMAGGKYAGLLDFEEL